MRPITVRKSAAGFTQWIPLNRVAGHFSVGIGVIFSSGANLTCSVQHTFDDIYVVVFCKISRTTTVATLKLVNHGLSVGDWIQVTNSGATNLDGTYSVASVVDADNITYTVANSGITADTGNAQVQIARVFTHLTLHDLTANNNGDYIDPVMACRLNVSAYTGGFVDLDILQGRG